MITPYTHRNFGSTTLPLPEIEGNRDERTTFAGWGPRI